jgi:hypothetical protein
VNFGRPRRDEFHESLSNNYLEKLRLGELVLPKASRSESVIPPVINFVNVDAAPREIGIGREIESVGCTIKNQRDGFCRLIRIVG